MDLDSIKRTIQSFFQEETVTIVGSGLSFAEGIPGMYDLSQELRTKLPSVLSDSSDKEIWNKINNSLSSEVGLEQALLNTRPTPYIEDCIRSITAKFIGKADAEVFKDIIQGEKFLRFTEYLSHYNIRNEGLTVITTNYDRLIEYACECDNLRIDTLFIGKYFSYFEPEQSRYMFCEKIIKRAGKSTARFAPRITILKPHGCLSWHMINGKPYSIPNYPLDDCLIITPGLNKYKEGYSVPFDTHREKANMAIDNAPRYVIIGYGFGDDHLETHLKQQLKNGKPALILTYSLSSNAEQLVKDYDHVTAICRASDTESRIIRGNEDVVINSNLWDLHEMLKEVF